MILKRSLKVENHVAGDKPITYSDQAYHAQVQGSNKTMEPSEWSVIRQRCLHHKVLSHSKSSAPLRNRRYLADDKTVG